MALKFAKLDRASIRKLKPGEKITERGIVAECMADSDIRWRVAAMVDGSRIDRVIGRESEGVTRTHAGEFIEQARTEARHGRLNLPDGRKLALSFAEAAAKYLDRLEQSGGKNLVAKRRQLKKYLIPQFGSQRLDQLTDFGVERFRKQRRDAGATMATINRELATLSHLLNRAIEWKWIDRLPVKPKKYAETGGRIIALTSEECDRLMAAAVASANLDLHIFVAFGLNTGMRHSEIMAARWEQIDFPALRLSIPDAKAGKREQPITRELAALLMRERDMREDREGWIFPSPHADSGRGHVAYMARPFALAAEQAGLDPSLITPHVMRHTAITKLVEAGVDLPTIQKISGHKTLSMVLRYTHVRGPHIDAAMAALEHGGNTDGRTVADELQTVRPTQLRAVTAKR